MSYFTFASTEYDLPHPTLSRHQPRFYIPDRSAYSPGQSSTTALGGETLGFHSRHPSVVSYSGHSTPFHPQSLYGGSGSRPSLAALRHALHAYHRYPASTTSAAAPCACPGNGSGAHRDGCTAGTGEPHASEDVIPDRDHDWHPEIFGRTAGEPMEALIDIHRVLYRGMEDLATPATPAWAEQGKEVKRVVEQWFEGDCVYDHPLVRLSSRQSVLTHFALLQLFSTAYVPSLTPSSLLLHARNLTSRLRSAVLGSDDIDVANRNPSADKGKRVVDPVDEWLASSAPIIHRNSNADGWWKLWDVSAECRDIGCMECYEGYHIALIDHVVSLTLFPSILRRPRRHGLLCMSESSDSLVEQRGSFVTSLAASVLREFDFLLHWDLPISTIVEFNEVGKATHVRDVVDFQDVIDTFVPFAKRFSWLSRRVAGLLTSTMGSIALSAVPGHTVIVADALHIAEQRRASAEEGTAKVQEIPADLAASVATAGDKPPELGSPIALTGAALAGSTSPNLLGLEGITGSVQSMAPDVDVDGQSQEA